jgi:hypothetical protein
MKFRIWIDWNIPTNSVSKYETALFWKIMQHIVAIIYQRPKTNRLPRNVGEALPL